MRVNGLTDLVFCIECTSTGDGCDITRASLLELRICQRGVLDLKGKYDLTVIASE